MDYRTHSFHRTFVTKSMMMNFRGERFDALLSLMLVLYYVVHSSIQGVDVF